MSSFEDINLEDHGYEAHLEGRNLKITIPYNKVLQELGVQTNARKPLRIHQPVNPDGELVFEIKKTLTGMTLEVVGLTEPTSQETEEA